jgi:hypothetical protein
MSILIEIVGRFITGLLVDAAVNAPRSKRTDIMLSLLIGFLFLGVGLLFWWLLRPAPLESLQTIEVSYAVDRIYDDVIMLKANDKLYKLEWRLLNSKYKNKGDALQALRQTSSAQLWLHSANDKKIRGIATPLFVISPSTNYESDQSASRFVLCLFGFFFLCGCFAAFSVWYELPEGE